MRGGYSHEFVDKIRLSHDSGRVFDGIVPDRYGAVEALCIAKKVLWLDDNICIYNCCGKNTWGSTVKRGYESLHSFVSQSRKDMDYSDQLFVPGVVASASNIVASDYHNAVSSAVSSGYCRFGKVDIDRGYLAALVENELLDVSNISDAVLEEQKKLTDAYTNQLGETEKICLEKSRKQIKSGKKKFAFKSGIDKILYRGMDSDHKLLRIAGTKLELLLSRDTIIVKDLSDIR